MEKKIKLISFLLALVLVVTSCSEQKEEHWIELSLTEIDFAYLGGEEKIIVSSSSDWSITNTSDWITTDKQTGNKGDTELALNVSENTGMESRQAKIMFMIDNDQIELTVNQSAGEIVSLDKNELNVSYSGAVENVKISSNVSFVMERPVSDWVSVNLNENDSNLEVTVIENEAVSRTDSVLLKSEAGKVLAKLIIVQEEGGLIRKWYKENCGEQPYGSYYKYGENPCPEGYKIPNLSDYQDLIDNFHHAFDSKVEDNPGGVPGIWFSPDDEYMGKITSDNYRELGCLFLPAGGRIGRDGNIFNIDKSGCYITEELEEGSEDSIGSLYFTSFGGFIAATYGRFDTGYALSLRCIRID